jgi:hypothetical protein
MAEGESLSSMMQAAYAKLGDGSFAMQGITGPIGESGFGAGTVSAPGADTLIATHQPPGSAAGKLHQIEAVVWFSAGTPAAADNFNMGFKFGGTLISKIPIPPVLNQVVRTTFFFKAAAGTQFAIYSVGAATAGVTYNAYISATKVFS